MCIRDRSHTAHTAQAAYGLIDRALTEFQTQRPRTKHIQVPIQALEADAKGAPKSAPKVTRISQSLPAEIAEQIASAKRPLFILGGGSVRASNEARSALRSLKAASFPTYAGRGIVSVKDDPLHFGSFLGRPESETVAASADLVIVVGSELSEMDLWRDKLGHTATMILSLIHI